jgi:hypothetical protein
MPFFAAMPWRSMAVLSIFLLGVWLGYQWHVGIAAKAQIDAQQAAEKSRQAIQVLADQRAMGHAEQIRTLNKQLGAAHAQIAQLSRRDCLDPGIVGMLNAIGTTVPAAASESADQAAAPASNPGHGLRFSTNRDLAEQIAVCRAAHAALADQLNAILDIEEARHAQKP